jgi:hypothetical protein
MELEGREGFGRQDLEDRKNAELIDTEKKDAGVHIWLFTDRFGIW